MRRFFIALWLCVSFVSFAAKAGEVVKVLPFFLDADGQIAKSPSLFDRDAYQYYLRDHTNEISGIRYDVQWKAEKSDAEKLRLCVELRGTIEASVPRTKILQAEVAPGTFGAWTELKFAGDDFKKFGPIIAWRATLWSGTKQVGEQKSFLW